MCVRWVYGVGQGHPRVILHLLLGSIQLNAHPTATPHSTTQTPSTTTHLLPQAHMLVLQCLRLLGGALHARRRRLHPLMRLRQLAPHRQNRLLCCTPGLGLGVAILAGSVPAAVHAVVTVLLCQVGRQR